MKPKPTRAQQFTIGPNRKRIKDARSAVAGSWWQKYSTGPREDGQLEAEAQVRALKGTAPILLQDWTSTV